MIKRRRAERPRAVPGRLADPPRPRGGASVPGLPRRPGHARPGRRTPASSPSACSDVSRSEALYVEMPGAEHAFDLLPSLRTARVVEGIERFLRGEVARPRPAMRWARAECRGHEPGDPPRRPGRPAREAPPAEPINRLDRGRVTVGGVETRATWAHGQRRRPPSSSTAGWTTPTPGSRCSTSWRRGTCAAIAYDQPGFGVAPPLDPPATCWTSSSTSPREAVIQAAERSGEPVVRRRQLARRLDRPTAGPAARPADRGRRRDRPRGDQDGAALLHGRPDPGRLAADLAPGARCPRAWCGRSRAASTARSRSAIPASIDQAVVDRFTRFNVDRAVIRTRIDYAKRIRPTSRTRSTPSGSRCP